MARSLTRAMTAVLLAAACALAWPVRGSEAEDSEAPRRRADPRRPASYDEFVVVEKPGQLASRVSQESFLYLPPGDYPIDNPLVIDRDAPLFLHGGSRGRTRLLARNPSQPLILVKRASLVNLANLMLAPSANEQRTDARALLTVNAQEIELELQDCRVDEAVLELAGPGRYALQGVQFFPRGYVQAPIVIDHPDADFFMIGGNISNAGNPARLDTAELFHVWQRRGRLQIYGTGVQATLGIADFRIDAPAAQGPHVIANVRSEGANGHNRRVHPATLLYVPKSEAPVDVLLKSNAGAWARLGAGRGRFVDYRASGTLWLLGNSSPNAAGALVVGGSGKARIFAIGNRLFSDRKLLPDSVKTRIAVGSLYSHEDVTCARGACDGTLPRVRFAGPLGRLEQHSKLPPIPDVEIREPIGRPVLNAALPGMLDVKAPPFNAKGDGVSDDTAAIQKALAAPGGDLLYFPAGTYRVTDLLEFKHADTPSSRIDEKAGGWIAGAGRGPDGRMRTVIQRDGSDAKNRGGVFATHGMAQTVIQGIAFRTAPYDPTERHPIREPAFALENVPGVGRATQEVMFYDVVFDGGRAALAIGLESRTQCSENMMIHSEFKNARYGLAVGSMNAIANLVYGGLFRDNQTTMGHDADASWQGGTWAVYGATVRGTRGAELELEKSGAGVWYFHGLDSDSSTLLETEGQWRDLSPALRAVTLSSCLQAGGRIEVRRRRRADLPAL